MRKLIILFTILSIVVLFGCSDEQTINNGENQLSYNAPGDAVTIFFINETPFVVYDSEMRYPIHSNSWTFHLGEEIKVYCFNSSISEVVDDITGKPKENITADYIGKASITKSIEQCGSGPKRICISIPQGEIEVCKNKQ